MGIFARLGAYLDASEALHGAARWCFGAALWLAFAAICAAPMACGYLLGRIQ